MAEQQKWALILGGCGTRGQKAAKRCIQDGYTVIVVDHTEDAQRQPENWPQDTNCNDSRNFAFYQEDVIKFLSEEHCFSDVKWDLVINYARVKDSSDYLSESLTNAIIDATFYRWACCQSPTIRPKHIIGNFDSLIGAHMLKHKHLWL